MATVYFINFVSPITAIMVLFKVATFIFSSLMTSLLVLPYGTFVFVSSEQFRWTSGEADVVNYKMPEALVKGTAFCRHCGSLVPRERDAGTMQIPAGSLDDDPRIRPIANIFTDSKAAWSEPDQRIACFPEYPT